MSFPYRNLTGIEPEGSSKYCGEVPSANHLRSIHFRFLGPSVSFPQFMCSALEKVWIPLQRVFDSYNTHVPFIDSHRLGVLKKVSCMKKMSTLAIGAIINEYVREMPVETCYLNMGTWYGYSLFAGMVGNEDKKCIGVDTFEQFDHPKIECNRRFEELRSDSHIFFEMDWRRYLAEVHRDKIGVLFYDADHNEQSQYESLVLCDAWIVDGGIVIVDDTNWSGPRRGTERFLVEHKNYEVLFDVPTACNCHPTFWNGLMILRKQI